MNLQLTPEELEVLQELVQRHQMLQQKLKYQSRIKVDVKSINAWNSLAKKVMELKGVNECLFPVNNVNEL